jgi:hypothetical protein
MAECCTCVRDEQTVLIWLIRAGMWPGVRRAGLPKAKPAADAGPAAPP